MTLAAVAVATVLAACGLNHSPAPAAPPASPGSGPAIGLSSRPASGVPGDSGPDSTGPDAVYTVTYPFGVPGSTVSVSHPVHPPIASPPQPPLPYLVGVYVGDHPEGGPPYQRMSFYFRGAFPSYRFAFVPAVIADGSGRPVPLAGNVFVQIVFTDAQAHNSSGGSTIAAQPGPAIGFTTMKGFSAAGDYEGHVSYGLGLQTAGAQRPRLRSGELTKPDGSGGFYYVVHLDVATT